MGTMMKMIIYITTAVVLLSSGSLSQLDPPPSNSLNTTVTATTPDREPNQPHNDSHGLPKDDDDDDDEDEDDDTPNDDTANDDSLHLDGDDDDDDDDDDGDDETYPNPRKDPKACHLGADPAWLCNEDDVLDKETANDLNEVLESMVDVEGICPCRKVSCSYTGFPMAVVVLKTITDYPGNKSLSLEEKEDHVHHLAQRFLNDWDFNTCNDGAVTVVVADEKIVETVIDHASEYLVPDDCEEAVEKETDSFFEDGDVEEGLTKLIQQYRSIVLKTHSCNSDSYLKASVVIPVIVVLALIIVLVAIAAIVVIYRRRGSRDIRTEATVPLKDQQNAEKA